MATFRIATFVNDTDLYDRMRESFEQAGFVEPLAVYTVEQGEPYSGVTRLGQASEPYVVLVHQDVLCDQGHTAADLLARLRALTVRDPSWAVAGNAGVTATRHSVFHVTDPHVELWHPSLPRKVATLDENFLVLRTDQKPHCSTSMSGFHLYASDVCLNAAAEGHSAYVIDFRLTHLSAGKTSGYEEVARMFVDTWNRRAHLRFVPTTNRLFFVSRWPPLRTTLGHPHLVWRLEKRMRRPAR